MARFFHPVVAAKKVKVNDRDKEEGLKDYERVHVSFQSTSSCNFSTVNSLNSCNINIAKKERGIGKNKRVWGIEMNPARELYLGTYSCIDSINHLIKNCHIGYRSWKYWHAPMNHGKALVVVIAYDIYLDLAEGKVDPEWKVENPIDFWTFRDILSTQSLEYSPLLRKYLGDESFRVCTKQTQAQRQASVAGCTNGTSGNKRGRKKKGDDDGAEFIQAFKKAKTGRGSKSRLCGDLEKLNYHMNNVESGIKHPHACVVCGEACYSKCNICGVYVHHNVACGLCKGKNCFFQYHDDGCFGVLKCDHELANINKADWKAPTAQQLKRNRSKVSDLINDKNGNEDD